MGLSPVKSYSTHFHQEKRYVLSMTGSHLRGLLNQTLINEK